ncbi:putative 3-demethylubiquinone-9 3-methyltransferase (glyoxalase superfamily) [Sinobaca qinghaiensis]|uniref:Putative 3-demethylubiquinone-9 3-methyltransferase (Glyoxalase superfamily) n=1 Tax=Sinobaca qinghaiensis TaxID=342944 RepID=A0A419V060_9BACL|nr:VOC family protein [Sinobaca qinghaiensis]RKD71299.1 putative 3-demethylubiquinone-9 3-methyltransferase (glyoxalase superfamily) [Sinobaca qinghaiensis]
MSTASQKITPCLWFDNQAEEAVHYYLEVFSTGKIKETSYHGEHSPGRAGDVLTIVFELEGQNFMALNGGPYFTFTPAVSMVIDCHSQEEVDRYWDYFAAEGKEDQCGWIQDKYGVSWQVVPAVLTEMLQDKDTNKAEAVMQAMLQMKKINISELKQAYDQV